MPKFIHADNCALYAEDAAECSEPWLRWQFRVSENSEWVNTIMPIAFDPAFQYRRKPRTIRIGEFDVPEPVREPLEIGQEYWLAETIDAIPRRFVWRNYDTDLRWLAAGLIHLPKEAAQIHIDALLSFTRRDK